MVLSICLFIYLLIKPAHKVHGFSYALLINSVPLFLMPQFSGGDVRLFGVPLAYLPIMAAGVPFIISSRIFKKQLIFLSCLMALFVAYITFTSFLEPSLGTLPYYFGWIFNFILLLCVANYFSKSPLATFQHFSSVFVKCLCLACLLGIARFVLGISTDANFLPMMNRNGTVVFIILCSPLLYYLRDDSLISNKIFWAYFIIFLSTILLIGSRAGIISFFFAYFFMHLRLQIKSLKYLASTVLVGVLVLSLSASERVSDRMVDGYGSVVSFITNQDFEAGEADYKRFVLIDAAKKIISENFWLGTGVGLTNYRRGFSEVVVNTERDSKAHNFYLSYFAELGLIGFTIIMAVFLFIYFLISVPDPRFKFGKAIFLSIAVIMLMSEYILLPEIWFLFGMLVGVALSYKSVPKVIYG